MDRQTDFLLNISVLYRSTQKYYDRMLQSIQLTYAQLPILIMIFEQEGITMRQIAESGVYDKGTISKNVKHLEQEGYILIQPSKQDKRNKELYTTDYAKQNMSKVYAVRRDWWQHLIQSIDQKQFEQFVGSYEIMAKNARQYEQSSPNEITFFDWKKVSLEHYPNQLSTVLYMGGSNFRSPFDTHPELVFIKESLEALDLDEICTYLNKRKEVLQAVCFEGGEPFMSDLLPSFLSYTKKLGYLNKVKTNGCFPGMMKDMIDQGLIDFVELQIMNSPRFYAKSIGMNSFDITPVEQSLDILKTSAIDYQCTLVLVKEYHSLSAVETIAKWLSGIKKLVVYTDIESCHTIESHLHNVEIDQLEKMMDILNKTLSHVEFRGAPC